ncbi:transposase, partial [Ureibacillus sp. MALMAid1270]|uniref:transposase n=1 Tax=Ureibacillus sp. MALMAid1270 TaxID=3411629 RepID=UPI003BA7D058
VFGHLKGNRSFRRFSLRGLKKVHIEFGIVAMAHNLLKVAGIRQLLSLKIKENRKQMNGKSKFPFICFLFRAFWTAPYLLFRQRIMFLGVK